MKRTVAACRVNGVAYNLPQSRSLVRLASQPTRSSSLLIAQQPRLLASSAFPASVRFTSRRGYSAQAAPQDFSEEEKEIAKLRQQGAKSPAAQSSVNQRRIEELFNSANGYVSEEKWTQAEDKLSTILDLQSSAKADDTLLGRVLINLAFVEQNIGKREKAEKHYEEGIAALKKTLGEDHHEVARGLLNYAEVLAFLSKVEQAEAVSRQAIPIFEKNYGPKSELVGALLSNLGGYLCAQKKLEEAEPVLKRALEVLDSALGCDNEYTSACLGNYARLLKDLDRNDQLNELKAKYSSNAATFTATEALEKDVNDPEMKAMVDQFKGLADSRAFNPEGLFKPDAFHKDELKKFITQWESKHKEKLDPALIPAVLEELEAMPREEIDKMCADALKELAESKRGGPAVDPSRLNAIADEIDDEALAEEEGDEGDDSSSSDSDDEEGEDEDDEIMERLDQGDEDEGDLWRATEAHEREAAKNIEIDMSHIELTDDKKQQ